MAESVIGIGCLTLGSGLLIYTSCNIIQNYNNKYKKSSELREELKIKYKELSIKQEELYNLRNKAREKHIFITKFIDEIPELSYYEAKQLKKKLPNIYNDWMSNLEEEQSKYIYDLSNEVREYSNVRYKLLASL